MFKVRYCLQRESTTDASPPRRNGASASTQTLPLGPAVLTERWLKTGLKEDLLLQHAPMPEGSSASTSIILLIPYSLPARVGVDMKEHGLWGMNAPKKWFSKMAPERVGA